jgi:hypothetical protein
MGYSIFWPRKLRYPGRGLQLPSEMNSGIRTGLAARWDGAKEEGVAKEEEVAGDGDIFVGCSSVMYDPLLSI